MGRNLSTDLSRPKLELIQPSKVSHLFEMMTAGLCFRKVSGSCGTVKNRLISYSRAVQMLLFLEH